MSDKRLHIHERTSNPTLQRKEEAERKKEKEQKLTVSNNEAAKSNQENNTMPKSRSDLDTAIITSQTKKKQTNKQTNRNTTPVVAKN
jgi:hypothetical protein